MNVAQELELLISVANDVYVARVSLSSYHAFKSHCLTSSTNSTLPVSLKYAVYPSY